MENAVFIFFALLLSFLSASSIERADQEIKQQIFRAAMSTSYERFKNSPVNIFEASEERAHAVDTVSKFCCRKKRKNYKIARSGVCSLLKLRKIYEFLEEDIKDKGNHLEQLTNLFSDYRKELKTEEEFLSGLSKLKIKNMK